MANWEWDIIVVTAFVAAVFCAHVGITIHEWVSRRTQKGSHAS